MVSTSHVLSCIAMHTPYDGLCGESVEKSVILLFKRPLIQIFRTDAPYSRIISILILSATCNENKTYC